jgi:hypothetical protein
MTKRKEYSEEKVREVIQKFNSLSEEEQKIVVKSLMSLNIGCPYVENRTKDELINMVLTFDGEEFNKKRNKAIRDISSSIDTLVDKVIYGKDKELTDRIVHKFVLSFKKTVSYEEKQLKKERNEGN